MVRVPAMIWRAPTYIMTAPTSPSSTLEERLITEVAVSVRITLSSRRCTPAANTECSRASAWYPLITRTPPSDSVRRPVTSALILPRSRKMGRMVPKALFSATPKHSRKPNATSVMRGLMRNSTTSAIPEVINPPLKSMSPVPSRLRTPSTSLMIRETSVPALLAS